MIREQITHNDLDGNTVTTVLYFNLTRIEVGENLGLLPKFEKFQSIFEEPERELTTEEIVDLLELIKLIMKISYGVRSEDGQRFIKNAEKWEEFTQTNAYDAFLFSLFEDPNKADRWMTGLLPQQLLQQATTTVPGQRPPTQDHQQKKNRPMQVVELPQPATEGEPSPVPDPDELAAFRAWQEHQKNDGNQ